MSARTGAGELDLVLIHPGGRMQAYQELGRELTAIEPPVWAGLMATYFRKKGFSVQIIDADADELTSEETAKRVQEHSPLLAAIVVYGHHPSASTQTMPAAGAVCAAIKQRLPQQKTILVGGHAAALPERTLREEAADFVAEGEGPVTLSDLLQALRSDRPEDLSQVRGLWYWEDKTVRANPPAPLVKNLDQEMEGVAWDLLPMGKYRAHNWHCFGDLKRQPYASMYTTLGCPYHCTFCCIQAPFKTGEKLQGLKESVNTYRYWSADTVIRQIDLLVQRYGVRNIKFADEMFVLNPSHIAGICDRIVERGYRLNIWAYARVDTVKEGMLEKLRRAGFNWLAFGIESANERVRDDAEKGFSQDLIFKTIRRVQGAGISIGANYIFGLPEDDRQTLQETLDLALELNAEWANFYCAMAYPGSQLYNIALQQKWSLPERWSGYSQHSVDTQPLPTKTLSGAEVLRFRDEAFRIYFTHPRYLAMITEKFGPETAEHIRRMASQRLIRKYSADSDPAVVTQGTGGAG